MLIGLAIAETATYCNAMSSARLAALYPTSGGTSVYGRERLGPVWGYLAGWGFVVGKTVWVTRLIVALVLAALTALVAACLFGGLATVDHIGALDAGGVTWILRSAGLVFFAFAGYALIAILGEEVVAQHGRSRGEVRRDRRHRTIDVPTGFRPRRAIRCGCVADLLERIRGIVDKEGHPTFAGTTSSRRRDPARGHHFDGRIVHLPGRREDRPTLAARSITLLDDRRPAAHTADATP